MTDYYDDDYDVAEEGQRPAGPPGFGERVSMWFGAFLFVAVIGGAGYWGYGLSQRDITMIPVIHAAIGPVKIQPDNADADRAGRQDITSYNAGSGDPIDLTRAPTIAFAPPPERPAAEDVPMGALQGGTPVAALAPAPQSDPTAAAGTPDGVGSSLAPVASPPVLVRPADLAQRVAAALEAESEEEKLASAAAASAVQIQLGAFPERELTESEWNRIYKANEDILFGRALVVQSTISGGRRFYRLRVGPFSDRIEAQNICRALQSRSQDCLVAVNN